MLFQIITEREERASVAIATSLPFSEWGTVLPDPRLVAAIVDRVTFNAHIIETGTKSYRLRTKGTQLIANCSIAHSNESSLHTLSARERSCSTVVNRPHRDPSVS
jgi:hypothetical protein